MKLFGQVGVHAASALRLTSACVVMVLTSCGGGSSSDGSASTAQSSEGVYLPLNVGDRRVYTNGQTGDTFIETVLAQDTFNGEARFVIRSSGSDNTDYSDNQLLLGSNGVKQYGEGDSDPFTRAVGTIQLIRWPTQPGDQFVQVNKTVDIGFDIDGDAINDRAAIKSVVKTVGFEAVATDAGAFQNCLHQHIDIEEKFTLSRDGRVVVMTMSGDEWYAPGIGLVKSSRTTTVNGSTNTSSIALTAFQVSGQKSETVAPTVLSVTPTPSATTTGIAVSAQFSEAIEPNSLPGHFTVRDSHGALVPGTAQINGTTVQFIPSQSWAADTYTARITQQVRDLIGNNLAADFEWTFTVDLSEPMLLSTIPEQQGVDVDVAAPITLQFSEPIDPKTVSPATVSLRLSNGDTVVETSAKVDGAKITLTPKTRLDQGKSYRVVVYGVGDTAGNLANHTFELDFSTDQGQFAYPKHINASINAATMAIGDVNGDGINDVLETSDSLSDSYSLLVFPGKADGTLGAPINVGNGQIGRCWPGQIAVADLNGDGRNDVVLGSADCGMQVFIQNPDGQLIADQYLNWGVTSQIRLKDMNGDGRLDVVTSSPNTHFILVGLGDSNGHFSAPQLINIGAISGTRDLQLGDINGDGLPDIIATINGGYVGQDVMVIRQNPDRSFGAPTFISANSSFYPAAIAVGDLNGDGRLDIVMSSGGNKPTALHVLYQQANGQLSTPVALSSYDIPGPMTIADMNGDGRLDIVVQHDGWFKVGIYVQQTDGSMAPEALYAAPYGSWTLQTLAVGDVNNDGLLDIVTGGDVILQKPLVTAAPLRTMAKSLSVSNIQRFFKTGAQFLPSMR